MTTQNGPRERIGDEEMRKLRGKGNKPVKGIFRSHQPPGGSLKFSYKKYPGDEVTTYSMNDGETYTVPLMVAKHINTTCAYEEHTHILDAQGLPVINRNNKVKRYTFESLEFNMED